MILKYYKMADDVQNLEYATDGAAAFDIRAYFNQSDKIRTYNSQNKETFLPVRNSSIGKFLSLQPGFRALIPTGIKFDIPDGYYLELVVRSSAALRFGIALANQVGVIDSDYVDELFVMAELSSDTPVQIANGDRIAQIILKKYEQADFHQLDAAPEKKGNRKGGLGSTGGLVGIRTPVSVENKTDAPATEEKRGRGRPKKI